MNAKIFEHLLDRFGANFDSWPPADAEQAKRLLLQSPDARRAYDALLRLEDMIEASRPQILSARAHGVVHRALADIARKDATPSLLERFRLLLVAPLPRAAFAFGLTAIGFAVGLAVGSPTTGRTFYTNGAPMMTASADDVLF